MTRDSVLRIHLPGILLALSLLIAVIFYFALPPERVARILFFPGAKTDNLTGERRLLPRVADEQRAIALVVEEILLGPADISHGRALPRETGIRSVILSGNTVYVDLDQGAMRESAEVYADIATGLKAIQDTVLFNFRRLESVAITINGSVPFAPSYRPGGR